MKQNVLYFLHRLMIQDEYNKVEITNEKQLLKVEFGKIQKTEFTAKKENDIPEGDLNEKYVGKTIKKVADVNVDYINKVPTHGAQTVVTGATTATSVGAAAASTAVAASTVAVVAIATVTGISIVQHDYKVDFKSLLVSANEIRYELSVIDRKDEKTYLNYYEESPKGAINLRAGDEEPVSEDISSDSESDSKKEIAPFTLRVYNSDYDATQDIWYHEVNSGVFTNLTLGNNYSIVLTENRYGGEVLFSDTVVARDNFSFFDFDISGAADFVEGTFDIYADFVDDKKEMSDFLIEFYNPEFPDEIVASFAPSVIKGEQSISYLDNDQMPIFDITEDWSYRFSYVINDEQISFKENKVTFFDKYGRESRFKNFVFDKTANLETNVISVSLDYIDQLNYFQDFVFVLTTVTQDGDEQITEDYSFPLEKTTDIQTIDTMSDKQLSLSEEAYKFTYRLECQNRGYTDVLVKETTPFTFTDSLGRKSEFNQLIFNKTGNFITNNFNLTLDYVDQFNYFQDFVFILTTVSQDGEEQYYDDHEFPLEKTTEVQTINTMDGNEIPLDSDWYQFTYRLECQYRGYTKVLVEETTPFKFTDNSDGVSIFNEFIFPKTADFLDYTFPITLDYQDDFSYYDGFELQLLPIGYNAEFNFSLEATTEQQTVSIDLEYEHYGFSFDYEYSYKLTAYRKGELVILAQSEDNFTFTDTSGAISDFIGLTFTGAYTISTGEAPVQLSYQDDFGYLSNFVLTLTGHFDDGTGGQQSGDDPTYEISLEETTEVQHFNLYENEIPTTDFTYTYSLSYDYRGETRTPIVDEPVTFDDPNAVSEVNGITFVNNEANFESRSFVVQLDFQDDYGYYDNFLLIIKDSVNGGTSTKSLDKKTTEQKVTINEEDYNEDTQEWYYPVDIVDGTLTYNVSYTDYSTQSQEPVYLYETYQPLSFADSRKSEFYGLESSFDFSLVDSGSYQEYRLPFRFDAVNDLGCIGPIDFYIADDEENILASISFPNEVVDSDWQFGSLTLNQDVTVEEITNGEEYNVIVRGDYYDLETEETETRYYYNEKHAFTLNQKNEICGMYVSNYLSAGDMNLSVGAVFNGDTSLFSDGQFVIEFADGTKLLYTWNVVSEYMGIDVLDPDDVTITEEEFEELLSKGPISVYFNYCILTPSQSGTGYDKGDLITIICCRDMDIEISH